MGGGQSIVNVDGELINAGEIDINDECKFIKCSPNIYISKFTDYNYYLNNKNNESKNNNRNKNNNKNNENYYLLVFLLFFLLLFLLFLFLFINKKMI